MGAVRAAKGKKTSKDEIMALVGVLKTAKEEYKSAVGSEYNEKSPPAPAAPSSPAAASGGPDPMSLYNKCKAAGDAVREAKGKKAAKDEIMALVGVLKAAKEEYKSSVGS